MPQNELPPLHEAADHQEKGCLMIHFSKIDPRDAVDIALPQPGIYGPSNEEGEPCTWPWEPVQLKGVPMGMYHCGYCGAMVIAGMEHMDYRNIDERYAAYVAGEEVKMDGRVVKYKHLRRTRSRIDETKAWAHTELSSLHQIRASGWDVFPLGGTTIAEVWDGDEIVAIGEAVCSDRDNYNKKIGRRISLGRALKQLS